MLRSYISLSALLLAALLLPPCSAHGKPMELKCSTSVISTHPVTALTTLPMLEEMAKRSGGEFEILYFNPGTLCSANELFNAGQNAVIELVGAPLGSAPALFPAAMALHMPFLFNNARAGTLVIQDMLLESPQFEKEFANWKVISLASSAPLQLISRAPILALEDLRGKKIAVTSALSAELITALGGAPVILPLTDTYLALQRGMVDACMLPIPTLRSTKVAEVGKYITICNLNTTPSPLLMNKKVYESMGITAQSAIDSIAGRPWSLMSATYADYFAKEDLEWVVAHYHNEVTILSPEEQTRWQDKAAVPVKESWLARAERQGVENPQQVLEQLEALAQRYNNPSEQHEALLSAKDALGDMYPHTIVEQLDW